MNEEDLNVNTLTEENITQTIGDALAKLDIPATPPLPQYLTDPVDETGRRLEEVPQLDPESNEQPVTTEPASSESTVNVEPTNLLQKVQKAVQGEERWSKTVEWREGLDAWMALPEGSPERIEAEKAWRLKHYGTEQKPSGFIYGSGKPGATLTEDLSSWANKSFQRLSAPGQGVIDFFGSYLPSVIPGINVPTAPKYDDKFAQGVRDISSYVLPSYLLTAAATAKLRALAASGKGGATLSAINANPLSRRTATFAFGLGSEMFVEGTNALSKEGLNALGSLKEMYPKFYQTIPYSIATHPDDSPDVKKNKAVLESGYFFIGSGILSESLKLIRAGNDLRQLGKEIIPKDSKAKAYFKRKAADEITTETAENSIEQASRNNDEAIEELAQYIVSKGDDLDKPIRGIHNVFDIGELVTRTPESDGIAGAMVRQVQIDKNIGTANGRLGSIVTEAALKFGLDINNLPKRLLVNAITDHIKNAGKFDAIVNGKRLTDAQIDEAGTKLAEIFIDPRSDTGVISGALRQFKDELNTLGLKRLDVVGYDATMKAIKSYFRQYFDMDVAKAQAYLATSLAGDVSDLSEGMRLTKGADSVKYAREMINDRLEYLMVEKGLASWTYGEGLRNLNVWERAARLGDIGKAKDYEKLAKIRHEQAVGSIIPEVKDTLAKFRAMTDENPEFFESLYMAYEWSDGKIDTIHKLNNFVQNKLGTWEKFVYDGAPEMPSMFNRAVWSNIYNSALSAFATPLKAGLGNLGGIISDPVSMFAGALLEGDWTTVRRGLAAYGSVTDNVIKANQHMGMVYRKASVDPHDVGYIMRDDLVLKNEEAYDIVRSYADAASAKGHDGASYLLNMYEVNEDLAKHPWLRFGANSMTALDGWTRSMKASAEARFRALDALATSGKEINTKSLKEAADDLYNNMFDSKGMIVDEAVDYGSREIALNLDGPLIQSINQLLARVPGLKPGIMFPRTATNLLSTFHKYSPTSAVFAGDYAKIARPKLATFENNPELVREILESKNIPIDENSWLRFRELRAKVKGRVAIGTSMVFAGWAMFTSDRLRGNGHYNKATQRTRYAAGWKPRTYKGLDGKWYSFDNMGPLSDWLALTADVMDNFDLITSPMQEEWLSKMMFVLAANITNKSVLGQLEPMNDMLAGNPAAFNRWGAAFANNLLPLGSQRNELGRLMSPALKELDQEFNQLLANRNLLLKDTLPNSYDWIDGKLIGHPDNFFVRAWNAYAPTFKMHGKGLSPERQFLIDIEFNGQPSFRTDGQGMEYTPKERAELQSLIGEEGVVRDEINTIMRRANRSGMISKLRNARRSGITSDILSTEDFLNYRKLIQRTLNRAVRRNEHKLSNYSEILDRKAEVRRNRAKAKSGILPEVLNIPK